MGKKIERLRSDVINQIAAGEVLENPASAVKELVENSIDAKSCRIQITIKGGGHHWIQIEDDGVGMCREDAIECLERHATSKIRQTEDLLKLSTMGFRGEALAAIASVSQMEIETSDGEESTLVRVDPGSSPEARVSVRNRGTTIDVRSLFYNVPARQKFQKSASSSASAVLRVIQTLALAHPDIAFSLISQEKEVFRVQEFSDWKLRAKEVLGDFAHEVKGQIGEYKIYGLIGSPQEAKGNRSCQYVFINKRPIFSPVVARAVQDGYSTRLIQGKYPSVLLFLELPPDEFDVNVHPQKRDVRFQDESKVYRLVERAVSQAFASEEMAGFSSALSFSPPPLPWEEAFPSKISREIEPVFQSFSFPEMPLLNRPILLIGSFALFEGHPLMLLDLKGAEARILFENIQKSTPDIQPLLLPLEIPLSLQESMDAEKLAGQLKTIGVEARFLGGRTLVIDALPVGVGVEDVTDFIKDFQMDRKIASMISRFCRSRKKVYSLEEAAQIDQRLKTSADPLYDPLGRLIRREIREEQVLQWFTQS